MNGIEPVSPFLTKEVHLPLSHISIYSVFICPLQLDSLAKAPEKVKHNFHIFQIFLNILFFPSKTLPDLTLDSLQSIVNGLG